MNLLKTLTVTLCLLSYIPLAFAGNGAGVIFEKTANKHESTIKKQIENSGVVDDVATFINNQFNLLIPLTIKFGGEDGPLYDSGSNEIIVPYFFIQEVEDRFRNAKYSETGVSIADATRDVVMHTLFHELAHTFIFIYKLPVVGKEEDAADALASMLLIEFFENGAEIALSAADLFDLESEDITEFVEEDFWDEHSLGAQRYYSTLCHVYGSDPKKYAYLKKDIGFSQERAALCIEEYEGLFSSWSALLEPHVKSKK